MSDQINNFLTDKNGLISLMNRIDYVDFMENEQDSTGEAYIEYILTDKYENRIDLITRDTLGNTKLYFFILWLNKLEDFNDYIYNEILVVPDGLTQYFYLDLKDYPIVPEFSSIYYTIKNQTYISIDTSIDDLTGEFTDIINLDSGSIDYVNGKLVLKFKNGCLPDVNSKITITYKRIVNNLKTGQIIKVPNQGILYRYYTQIKTERGI